MQYDFSCLPETYNHIEATLSQPRLTRYLHSARGDKHFALRLYLWNMTLCEALYSPLQMAEVAARNAIVLPVQKRFGNDWHLNSKFINILNKRMKDELETTLKREAAKRKMGTTVNHIIANLSFGFWVNLMAKPYDKHLWANGIRFSFPSAGPHERREEIYQLLDEMRLFRNDVMHHYAIFDKEPHRKYQNLLKIVELICPETAWLVGQTSRVSQVINERPTV